MFMLDGFFIVWFVIEYFYSFIKCRILVFMYYYQLVKFVYILLCVDCYYVMVKYFKDGLSFMFKVIVSKKCKLYCKYQIKIIKVSKMKDI